MAVWQRVDLSSVTVFDDDVFGASVRPPEASLSTHR